MTDTTQLVRILVAAGYLPRHQPLTHLVISEDGGTAHLYRDHYHRGHPGVMTGDQLLAAFDDGLGYCGCIPTVPELPGDVRRSLALLADAVEPVTAATAPAQLGLHRAASTYLSRRRLPASLAAAAAGPLSAATASLTSELASPSTARLYAHALTAGIDGWESWAGHASLPSWLPAPPPAGPTETTEQLAVRLSRPLVWVASAWFGADLLLWAFADAIDLDDDRAVLRVPAALLPRSGTRPEAVLTVDDGYTAGEVLAACAAAPHPSLVAGLIVAARAA